LPQQYQSLLNCDPIFPLFAGHLVDCIDDDGWAVAVKLKLHVLGVGVALVVVFAWEGYSLVVEGPHGNPH
jgi:hypothetical protein